MLKRKEFHVMLVSLVVSFILTTCKFLAYFTTHSVAILSDALESIINVVAGAFALYSIYLASQPKDENHPYGHGKVEFFSIGFEGAMIFIAGCLILFKSAQYIVFPRQMQHVNSGIFWIAGAAVANFFLGLYLRYHGRRIPSITISGNGQHILTDAWSSLGLITALLIILFSGWTWVDPLASVLLGSLILYKGYKLMRRSISGLMDETDMKMVDDVISILSENRKPQWVDIHNMRIQQYGNNYHIDCHLTLPYYYQLDKVHDEIKSVAAIVDSRYTAGEVEFFIHSDPCVPSCCKFCLLSQCPVRSHDFEGRIAWTRKNVLPNRKHGDAFSTAGAANPA